MAKNLYIIDRRIGALPSSWNVVLLSNTVSNTLDNGGWMLNNGGGDSVGAQAVNKYNYTLQIGSGSNDDGSALTVTLGGNRGDASSPLPLVNFVVPEMSSLNNSAATIDYTASGAIKFAADTGAYVPQANDDHDIVVSATGRFDIRMNNHPPILSDKTSFHAAQDTDISTIRAAGDFTVIGDMAGRLQATNTDVYLWGFQYPTTNGAVYVNQTVGSSVRAAGIRAASLTVTNNFNGSIVATVAADLQIYVALNVSNNTISAFGILTAGAVTLANGYWGGSITASNTTVILNANESNRAVKSVKDGKIEYADAGKEAVISNNDVSVYGIKAGSVSVKSFTGTINATSESIRMLAEAATQEKDPNSSTISNNKITAKGIETASFTVAGNFTGTINASLGELIYDHGTTSNKRYITGNTWGAFGIDATGTISCGGNFAGAINLSWDSVRRTTSYLTEPGTVHNESAGLSATNITVKNGYIRTAITLAPKRMSTIGNSTAYQYGIHASDTLNTLAMDGDIRITSDNVWQLSIGLAAESKFTNDNDGIFDITGSIRVTGDSYYNVAIMKNTGMNLRISGDVYGSTYAICATKLTFSGNNILETYSTANDNIELAAGARVTGLIDLSAGQNYLTVDSNARFVGSLAADLGKLNLAINLNSNTLSGVAPNDLAPTLRFSDINDVSLASVTTITINLNDARIGTSYCIVESAGSIAKWKNREVTFVYQGTSGVTTIGSAANGFTVAGSFSVNTIINDANGQITVKVNALTSESLAQPVATAKAYANADILAKKAAGTIAISWANTAGLEAYELEYRVISAQGQIGNSIVVMLGGNANGFDITGIADGEQVEWRVRQHYGKNTKFSDWTTAVTTSLGTHTATLGSTLSTGIGSHDYESIASSAVIDLKWDDIPCSDGLQLYEIDYFQCDSDLAATGYAPNWDAMSVAERTSDFFDGKHYVRKTVSTNTLLVSGLNNTEFFHWRIRAVDNNNQVGEWTKGDLFRIYIGDIKGPSLNDEKFKTELEFDPGNAAGAMKVTVSWDEAVDTDKKSGLAGYYIEYRSVNSDGSYGAWVARPAISPFKADGTPITSDVFNLANGKYQFRMYARDYAGNQSVISSVKTLVGDTTAPVFANGEELSVSSAVFGAGTGKYCSVQLSWGKASDSQGSADSAASGFQKYVVKFQRTGSSTVYDYTISTRDITTYTVNSNQPGLNLQSGRYTWWVEAYDKVGNVTSSGNSNFIIDLDAPTGSTITTNAPVIRASWGEIVTPATDKTEETIEYYVIDAALTLSFASNFTDALSGIRYMVQVSDNAYFGGANVREFYTDTTSLVLDSNTPGLGLLSTFKDIYWRVQPTDTVGNNTNYWFNGSSFQLVDPATGRKITDTVSPTTPTLSTPTLVIDTTDNRKTVDVTFSWTPASDAFGIARYELAITRKGGSRETFTVTGDKGKYVYAWKQDGNYTCQVRAIDGSGRAGAWSTTLNFALDTTAPVLNGASISDSSTDGVSNNADLRISWAAATDNMNLLAGYEITYTRGGVTFPTITVDAKTTSYWLRGLTDGTYGYQVRAFDTSGNYSAYLPNGSQTVTIDTQDDPGSSFSTATSLDWDKTYKQSVGTSDPADFYKFTLAKGSKLSLAVAGVAGYEGQNGITIQVYDANGKTLKKYTVKSGRNLTDVLLSTPGTYYIGITAAKQSNLTKYELDANYDDFAAANMWRDDAYNAPDITATKVTVDANAIPLVQSEWVGFSDTRDFRQLDMHYAGSYTFNIDSSDAAKLHIYQLQSNGKLKELRNVSVAAGSARNTSRTLLEKGTYYLCVESTNAAKGGSAAYNVNLNPGDTIIYTQGNNADDTAAFATANGYTVTVDQTAVPLITGEWVGFGDRVDFRELHFTCAGQYDFTVTATDAVKLAVISSTTGKTLKTLSVKAGSSATLRKLLLDKGQYYISVESTNYSKNAGGNASYEVTLGADSTIYTKANNADDTLSGLSLEYQVTATDMPKMLISNEWVGYGDLVDYRLLNLTYDGKYTFDLEATGTAKLSLCTLDAKGNLKVIKNVSVKNADKSISGVLLQAGTYYLKVETTDAKKSLNSDSYQVELDNSSVIFTRANNTDDTVALVNATPAYQLNVTNTVGSLIDNEWVGYGDLVDYRMLNLANAGKYTFNLVATGTAKLSLCTLDAKGNLKVVKNVSVKNAAKSISGVLLQAGTYYLKVETTDAKKSLNSDSYQVGLDNSSAIFTRGNNADDTVALVGATSAYQLNVANTAGSLVTGEWVGHGDATDFRMLTLDYAGNYSFNFTATDAARLTVYSLESNGKLKKLSNASVKAGGVANLKPLMLAKGTYYVEVTSTNATKGGNATYSFGVGSLQTFTGSAAATPGNNTLASATALAFDAVNGAAVDDQWIGFGDRYDYFKFTLGTTAKLDINLALDNPSLRLGKDVKVALYNAAGRSQALDADFTSKDALNAGTYYVGVSSANEKKYMSSYDLDIKIA